MCGSGTLPIEACWIALRRPPALTRRRFGFHGWLDFDIQEWTEVRDAARRQVRRDLSVPIVGTDLRRDAIALAEEGARAAGVGHLLRFGVCDVRKADAMPPGIANSGHTPPTGLLICNPPYGERIGDEAELRSLYEALGRMVRERYHGWSAWIFSGNPLLEKVIGLEPRQAIPLYNGRLPCTLLEYRA
jgi:putative N6-adenine-specific DNA methylase